MFNLTYKLIIGILENHPKPLITTKKAFSQSISLASHSHTPKNSDSHILYIRQLLKATRQFLHTDSFTLKLPIMSHPSLPLTNKTKFSIQTANMIICDDSTKVSFWATAHHDIEQAQCHRIYSSLPYKTIASSKEIPIYSSSKIFAFCVSNSARRRSSVAL